MKANQNVLSANRTTVLIDGKRVGYAQNVDMSDDYGLDAASGIGDIHVFEHVPTVARHSISVGTIMMRKSSLLAMGIVPENGEAALKGLVFDFETYDADGNRLRGYMGCSYNSGSISVQKHAIVASNCQLMALNVVGTAS